MLGDETLRLLTWHVGVEGDPEDPRSVSGVVATGEDVAEAVKALVAVLARCNTEMNGPRPSKTTTAPPATGRVGDCSGFEDAHRCWAG
jgi:hypothetical protein